MLGLSLVGDLQSLCYSSWKLASAPTLAPVGCWMCPGLLRRASRTPLSTQFSSSLGQALASEGNKMLCILPSPGMTLGSRGVGSVNQCIFINFE